MKQIIKGVLSLLNNQEKTRLGRLILNGLAISVLDIAFLGLLLLVVGFYTTNQPSVYFNKFLPDAWANRGSIVLIGIFLALFALKNLLGYLALRQESHFFYSVASRLSKKNIMSYLRGNYEGFVNTDSSVHIRRISQQPVEFSYYILSNAQQVVSQSILILITIGAILFYHPVLFLLLLVLLVPPVILLAGLIRLRSKKIREQTGVASRNAIQYLQESLAGFIESNVYGKDDFLIGRYFNYQQQLNNNLATQQTLQGLPTRMVEVFAVGGFFILVMVNKWWANGPTVDLLTIGIFMAAAYKIIPGIIKILNCTGQIKTYEFTLNDLLGVEEHNPFAHAAVAPVTSVSFSNVSFAYKSQPVLVNINFTAEKGDMAGLSAPSGRGKTTLINLLLGFVTPAQGTISINGAIADNWQLQQYRQSIAYVKQQTYFIHDIISKNITLSDGKADEHKLAWVIEFCGLNAMLAESPEGLEKVVSENGKNLSGGQRQRVMLARALYHDFAMLILDEPFGELDQQAEEAILVKLQRLAKEEGKIILLITHNQASLAYCNKQLSL